MPLIFVQLYASWSVTKSLTISCAARTMARFSGMMRLMSSVFQRSSAPSAKEARILSFNAPPAVMTAFYIASGMFDDFFAATTNPDRSVEAFVALRSFIG